MAGSKRLTSKLRDKSSNLLVFHVTGSTIFPLNNLASQSKDNFLTSFPPKFTDPLTAHHSQPLA
jgi:hypothetical protein